MTKVQEFPEETVNSVEFCWYFLISMDADFSSSSSPLFLSCSDFAVFLTVLWPRTCLVKVHKFFHWKISGFSHFLLTLILGFAGFRALSFIVFPLFQCFDRQLAKVCFANRRLFQELLKCFCWNNGQFLLDVTETHQEITKVDSLNFSLLTRGDFVSVTFRFGLSSEPDSVIRLSQLLPWHYDRSEKLTYFSGTCEYFRSFHWKPSRKGN